MIRRTLMFLSMALLVSACGNRAQFDRQLVEGCKAGLQHILSQRDPAFELKNVLDTANSKSQIAPGGRKITITAEIQAKSGSGFPEEEEIVCHFKESISFAGLVYSPSFYQIKLGDQRYGRDADGNLINDISSFSELSDAVAQALNNAG